MRDRCCSHAQFWWWLTKCIWYFHLWLSHLYCGHICLSICHNPSRPNSQIFPPENFKVNAFVLTTIQDFKVNMNVEGYSTDQKYLTIYSLIIYPYLAYSINITQFAISLLTFCFTFYPYQSYSITLFVISILTFWTLSHWGWVTHICVSNITSLVQIMACRLDDTKLLSEPIMEYCWLEP